MAVGSKIPRMGKHRSRRYSSGAVCREKHKLCGKWKIKNLVNCPGFELSMRNLIRVVIVALLFSNSCFADNNQLAYVSLDEATKQIIEGTYNKVLGAETVTIDGRAVHVIKVLTPDGRIQYFKIDAETGQLVS
jgi:hypothetical protein